MDSLKSIFCSHCSTSDYEWGERSPMHPHIIFMNPLHTPNTMAWLRNIAISACVCIPFMFVHCVPHVLRTCPWRSRAADKDSSLTGHLTVTQGLLFMFVWTNNMVDRTRGCFVSGICLVTDCYQQPWPRIYIHSIRKSPKHWARCVCQLFNPGHLSK